MSADHPPFVRKIRGRVNEDGHTYDYLPVKMSYTHISFRYRLTHNQHLKI